MVNNYAGKQKSGGERHFFVSVLCPNFISMGLWHSALHIAAAQATGANIHPLHSPYKKEKTQHSHEHCALAHSLFR